MVVIQLATSASFQNSAVPVDFADFAGCLRPVHPQIALLVGSVGFAECSVPAHRIASFLAAAAAAADYSDPAHQRDHYFAAEVVDYSVQRVLRLVVAVVVAAVVVVECFGRDFQTYLVVEFDSVLQRCFQ